MPYVSVDVDLSEFDDSDILEAADDIREAEFDARQGGLAGMEEKILSILSPIADRFRRNDMVREAIEVEEIMAACR